jgi:hypothetical protein
MRAGAHQVLSDRVHAGASVGTIRALDVLACAAQSENVQDLCSQSGFDSPHVQAQSRQIK